MLRINHLLLFLTLFPIANFAQYVPSEGSKLNYRIAGFSVPTQNAAINYTLEIAKGNFNNEDAFSSAIFEVKTSDKGKLIAELPSFGTRYTWRMVYTYRDAAPVKSPLHHFSTGYCPDADTSVCRLRIIRSEASVKDGYVFMDATKTINDMEGRPVWYLPLDTLINSLHADTGHRRGMIPTDFKISSHNSITLILQKSLFEINYQGHILWKGPEQTNGLAVKNIQYHHEFTRLSNGNYLALGNQDAYILRNYTQGRKNVITDSAGMKQVENDPDYRKAQFGIILMFNAEGKLVWHWDASEYYKESDVHFRTLDHNNADVLHENAVYFNEENSNIFLSMRDCSRILKIAYPGGEVLRTYGETFKPGEAEQKNGLFYGQHACKLSQYGDLMLFNNNVGRDSVAMPEVLIMKEPDGVGEPLKTSWQYNLAGEDGAVMKQNRNSFNSGGNVIGLPDHSVFIYLCGTYSKLLIANEQKQTLWSAIPEKWDAALQQWSCISGNRTSYCTKAEFENLIWGSEEKQMLPVKQPQKFNTFSIE